jgi:hypothetical protein
MPSYVRKVEVKDEHLVQIPVSSVNKSLFIRAAWADMQAIIKIVMIKYRNLFLKITSDREILDVYLGKTARLARAAESRGSSETGDYYNSVQELMDPPHLCVVKLNEILYKNKAASSVLEEALCYRLDRDKPTWIFSDYDRPFNESSTAYSESVMYLMSTAMKGVGIKRITPKVILDPIFTLDPIQSNFDSHPSKPEREERPEKKSARAKKPPEPEDAPSDILSQYGSGLGPKKQFGGRR